MSQRSKKLRVGVQLPAELVERARDAVYWTPGLTLNKLAEIALAQTLECLETLRGNSFPPRTGSLPVGRRIR
jgi:post-segregation antitoxin (ccd killing protein)